MLVFPWQRRKIDKLSNIECKQNSSII
jgi:hypothetical protein